MKHDYSYGIIPLRVENGQWEVLLVRHQAGHWAFPKGHSETGETFQQTAERELKEETALSVIRYISPIPLTEEYFFSYQGHPIHKIVSYFLALVGGEVIIQQLEIQDSAWIPLVEAKKKITFREGKKICEEVEKYLKI